MAQAEEVIAGAGAWVPATSLDAGLLALVFVVLPFLIGWWTGTLRRSRRILAWAIGLPLLSLGMSASDVLGLSPNDLLSFGLLGAAGLFFSTRTKPTATLALATISLSGALTVGELAARRLLPPLGGLPPVTGMTVLFDEEPETHGCEALFPSDASSPSSFAARWAHADADRRPLKVLHVGDSMLEGAGVSPDETVTAELGRLQPDVAHVNAGYGGTGTDLHLEVIRRWTAAERFDLVVIYPYGNDVTEIGKPYSCCGGGSLLSWEGVEPKRQCTERRAVRGLMRLRTAPLPFVLRAAATRSRLAGALVQVPGDARPPTAIRDARHLALHREVAALTLERRLPLLVFPVERSVSPVVQPALIDAWRSYYYPPEIHVVEGMPEFAAELAALDAEQIYLPNDPHWTPEGHRRVARFLAPQIRALLSAAP